MFIQICTVVVLLWLTLLTGCCEPYKEKTYHHSLQLEKINIVNRVTFEEIVLKPNNKKGITDTEYFGGSIITGSFFWEDPVNLPYNYGKYFFQNFSTEQDLFLKININSDHTLVNGKGDTRLFVPSLGFCDSSRDGTTGAFIVKNKTPETVDNLNHFSNYFSIPMLISQGKITEPGAQEALCIKTWGSWQKGATCGNKGIKWKFNDIRIEANQIETIMQNLKDQGIEYDYPEKPIDYDTN